MRANWTFPTAIRFGAGTITELAAACASAGIIKPLFVTDRGLAKNEITSHAMAILETAGIEAGMFAEVDPNPSEKNLEAGLRMFRSGGFDGVVAFGGGSGIDLGKMIAFMAGQSRPVWDFEDVGDWWKRADTDGIRPIVAVPTTAGTGSEVGRASVITNSETQEKKIIFHPMVLPSKVICDPELTVSMPAHITAGTGMDAFAHCLEAYCAPNFHPMCQGIALEGMRLVWKSLPTAFADPANIPARSDMMCAASMGAVAFQKGLGAIHSLSHPVGAIFGCHHGTTNAVVMPFVLEFNRKAVSEKLGCVAAYLGVGNTFDDFYQLVMELRAALKIPVSLASLRVDPARVDELAEMAVRDPTAGGNPVPLTIENTRELYQRCF